MKSFKLILTGIAAAVLMVSLPAPAAHAQVVNTSAKKKISIGFGMFTDLYLSKPDGLKTRTINQGVDIYGTYNMPFGKSNFSFAAGLGICVHNLYWNYRYQGDSTAFQFVKIEDSLKYKRSKVTVPYLEIPIEFRYKSKGGLAVGLGFKLGFLLYAHSKYVGDDYLFNSGNQLKYSAKGIKNLEKLAYGPTFRIGYKWFNVTAYYSLSNIFQSGYGRPELAPLSIGFVLLPF